MSRAPFVLTAAVIFCASSFLAFADEKSTISTAIEQSNAAAIQKADAEAQKRGDRTLRHYRGYDEAPAAMIASSRPV